MSKIVWDKTGERYYETGVDHGVLYPIDAQGNYNGGVPWNGLTSVDEGAEGGESNPIYADNIKYLNLMSAEEYNPTIEAYTYPDEFMDCDGSREIVPGMYAKQQTHKPFGFCYRTLIGNDTEGTDLGYKLHLVYGCQASPSEKSYETINDDPDAITFSWEVSTTPVELPGFKPTAVIEIDSRKFSSDNMTALENILYGTENTEPRLPLPSELVTLMPSPTEGAGDDDDDDVTP